MIKLEKRSGKLGGKMRKRFAELLYELMKENKDIYTITGDLGYKQFDEIRKDFPDRFLNVGAAEQVGLDICVGLALEGKIPFWYSITPFAIYRGFETIRTYIDHENIPVKIIGGGRDSDYAHDGFSHYAGDDKLFMTRFNNIQCWWPEDNQEMETVLRKAVDTKEAFYINIRRS